MKCKNCGAELTSGAHFCLNCGAEVVGPEDVICPSCGAHNTSREKYCRACGWPLQEENDTSSSDGWTYNGSPQVVKKNSNTGVIIVLSILVGVLLIGALFIGTYMLARNSSESAPGQTTLSGKEGNTGSSSSNLDADESYDQNAYYEDTSSNGSVSSGSKSSGSSSSGGSSSGSSSSSSSGPTFKYVVADVTWDEALADARSQGGRLAVLDTEEKFNKVTSDLNDLRANGSNGRNFFIGGTNHGNGFHCWVDANGKDIKAIDPIGSWFWLPGEPSYYDDSTGLQESYLEILYRKDEDRWYANDTINDPTSVFSELSGRTGYIIEFN